MSFARYNRSTIKTPWKLRDGLKSGVMAGVATASARKSDSIFGKYDASIQKGKTSFVRPIGRTAH